MKPIKSFPSTNQIPKAGYPIYRAKMAAARPRKETPPTRAVAALPVSLTSAAVPVAVPELASESDSVAEAPVSVASASVAVAAEALSVPVAFSAAEEAASEALLLESGTAVPRGVPSTDFQ